MYLCSSCDGTTYLICTKGCTTQCTTQYLRLPASSSRVQAVQQYSPYELQQYSTYELACTQCTVYSLNYEHCSIPEHVQTPKSDISSCLTCNVAVAVATAFPCCCCCRARRVSARLQNAGAEHYGGETLGIPCSFSRKIGRPMWLCAHFSLGGIAVPVLGTRVFKYKEPRGSSIDEVVGT